MKNILGRFTLKFPFHPKNTLVKIGSETAELLRTRVKEVLKKGKVEITIGMQIPC